MNNGRCHRCAYSKDLWEYCKKCNPKRYKREIDIHGLLRDKGYDEE